MCSVEQQCEESVFQCEKVDICSTPSNSKEFTMANFPAHMFHIGELIFISVNTFQEQTRVHIRVYATDDRGILHPTKNGVSLKPEVWSALHSKLCGKWQVACKLRSACPGTGRTSSSEFYIKSRINDFT
ncbi:PC4 domain-containing protein [Trichonephila clavipes]|nr:PC4 domain-containing protein [Trichonephila clavipes]